MQEHGLRREASFLPGKVSMTAETRCTEEKNPETWTARTKEMDNKHVSRQARKDVRAYWFA